MSSPTLSEQQVETASRGRSLWSACCAGCILFIVALVIGSFVVGQFFFGSDSSTITSLPKNYPSDLVLYRIEDVDVLTYAAGQNRGKMMQALQAPLQALARLEGTASSTGSESAHRFTDAWKGYSSQVKGMDVVMASWRGLRADKNDVLNYYTALFSRVGMTMQAVHDPVTSVDIVLAQRINASIEIRLTDTSEVPGIDDLRVTVQYLNR